MKELSKVIKLILTQILIPITFVSLFSVNAQAQTNQDIATFDFTAPEYFSSPVWDPTPNLPDDPTVNRYQITDIEDNGRGFKIVTSVTQCIPYNFGSGSTCQGIAGTQGAFSLKLVSLDQSTRFKKAKLHLAAPSPVNNNITIGVSVEVDNNNGDPLSTLQCTSSLDGTIQSSNTMFFDLKNIAVHQVDLEISCNKNLKRIVFESVGKSPGVINSSGNYIIVSNPILLKSVEVSGGTTTIDPAPIRITDSTPSNNTNQRPLICQGSVLNVHEQSAGEIVNLAQTGLALSYQSAFDDGGNYQNTVSTSYDFNPASVPVSRKVDIYVNDLNNNKVLQKSVVYPGLLSHIDFSDTWQGLDSSNPFIDRGIVTVLVSDEPSTATPGVYRAAFQIW